MNLFIPLKIRAFIAHPVQHVLRGTKQSISSCCEEQSNLQAGQQVKPLPPLSPMDRHKAAQSFVEFALALPILLLLIFGTIEFGRLLQAWLALENGARFAVRYAVTGNFNPTYCDAAGHALKTADGTQYLYNLDLADGQVDCTITLDNDTNYEDDSNRLQDWARLPSIRDTALGGATGIAWDGRSSVSGDYQAYLTGAYTSNRNISGGTRINTYEGNPSTQGYFAITTCSTRRDPTSGDFFQLNANPLYYNNIPLGANRFPTYCQEAAPPSSDVVSYLDDAGGPGDRVHVILTYRHTMITPFLSSWWPTLLLTSERQGIVEKFRTSRITGLVGDITYASTWTDTPTTTGTATTTDTPTMTSTPSNTPTSTATFTKVPTICPSTGQGLLGEYFFNTNYTALVHTQIDGQVNFSSGNLVLPAGMPNSNFSIRWIGQVQAPYTGTYTFDLRTDDGSSLSVNNQTVIPYSYNNGISDRIGTINLVACTKYQIEMDYMNNSGVGSAAARLRWVTPIDTNPTNYQPIPKNNLIPDTINLPTITPSFTPIPATATPITPTKSATPVTPTKSATPITPTTPAPTTPVPTTRVPTTPAPTKSRTPTLTPVPCHTPIEMGGCP